MAFSATLRVVFLGTIWVEGLRVAANESKVAGTQRELGVAVGGGMDGPAALHSAGVHCSSSTCHVASCHVIDLLGDK